VSLWEVLSESKGQNITRGPGLGERNGTKFAVFFETMSLALFQRTFFWDYFLGRWPPSPALLFLHSGYDLTMFLPSQYLHPMWIALYIWVALKLAAFIVGRVSCDHWRHTSAYDVIRIVLANSAGSFLGGLAILVLLGPFGIPHSVYILDWLLACLLTPGYEADSSGGSYHQDFESN